MNFILDVITEMSTTLDKDQLNKLKMVLSKNLANYELTEKSTEIALSYDLYNDGILKKFYAYKSIEGSSDKTLAQYKFHIDKALQYIQKPFTQITEDDIFLYIATRKQQGASSSYLRTIRQDLSSIFSWLYDKGYVKSNPVRGVKPIKVEAKIKKALSDVELEKLKRNAKHTRDLVILEVLVSTGIRVAELVGLNRNDVDFVNGSMKVFGKGRKERIVYMSQTANFYLQNYLADRTDDNEALFISLRKPVKRISIDSVQSLLKKLGQQTNIEKVHPHKFRRTLATNLLNKGMPLENVSRILGHAKLDTTMGYCNVSDKTIQNEYNKIMCS